MQLNFSSALARASASCEPGFKDISVLMLVLTGPLEVSRFITSQYLICWPHLVSVCSAPSQVEGVKAASMPLVVTSAASPKAGLKAPPSQVT